MWTIDGNSFDFSITRTMTASREDVFQVLANLEAYPDFVSDIVFVEGDGDRYRVVARAAILTIPATVAVRVEPPELVAFDLIEGPVDVLNGAWRIKPGAQPGETEVTLTVHMEAGVTGEWLLRMTGRFVESKTDKLITAFMQRVRQIQEGDELPARAPRRGWRRILSAAVRSVKRVLRLARSPSGPGVAVSPFRDDHRSRALEALALMIIPADDFDDGAAGLGFPSVVEVRSRYQEGREHLYLSALDALDQVACRRYGKDRFTALTPEQRATVFDGIRRGEEQGGDWKGVNPSAFFTALWEDAVFLYCTHPDTWERIGFPGPSFSRGGYPDAALPLAAVRVDGEQSP